MDNFTKYTCECNSSFSSKKLLDNHKSSKLHELRLKYGADENNKVYCNCCNIKIQIHMYEQHLNSIKHSEKSTTIISKVKCTECGKSYRHQNYNEHLKTKAHMNKLNKKITTAEAREKHFEDRKDKSNSCTECKRVDMLDRNYNKEFRMCNYCYEVSIASTRTCVCCNESKLSSLFERPMMRICKKCASHKHHLKTKKTKLFL